MRYNKHILALAAAASLFSATACLEREDDTIIRELPTGDTMEGLWALAITRQEENTEMVLVYDIWNVYYHSTQLKYERESLMGGLSSSMAQFDTMTHTMYRKRGEFKAFAFITRALDFNVRTSASGETYFEEWYDDILMTPHMVIVDDGHFFLDYDDQLYPPEDSPRTGRQHFYRILSFKGA